MDQSGLPTLARQVRERRSELGLTAEGAIDRMPKNVRISVSGYRMIESGATTQPTGKTISALSAALDVPEDTIRLWVAGVDGGQAAPAVLSEPGSLAERTQRLVDELVAARQTELSPADYVVGVLRCLSDDQQQIVFEAVDRVRVG